MSLALLAFPRPSATRDLHKPTVCLTSLGPDGPGLGVERGGRGAEEQHARRVRGEQGLLAAGALVAAAERDPGHADRGLQGGKRGEEGPLARPRLEEHPRGTYGAIFMC